MDLELAGPVSISVVHPIIADEEIKATDSRRLKRDAERMVKDGTMPSLAEVRSAIAEVRKKYRPLILAARKDRETAR